MKIKQIGEPKVIMANANSHHSYFGWPTASRLRNGDIAVAASGFRLAHVCPFGKAVMSISCDDGETYTFPAPIIDTPLDDRDAGLCPFGKSGLILTSFNNTVAFQRDCQDKQEESATKRYIVSYLDTVNEDEVNKYFGSEFTISFDNGVTFGEIFKSPITSPHGPVELRDGSILWVGTEHKPCDWFDGGCPGILSYKLNTDGTMEYLGEIPQIYEGDEPLSYAEPYAFECNDGTVICHIRENRHFTLFQSESHDGGKTWTAPHRLLPNGSGAPSHIMRHSSGILIATYGYRTPPYEIRAMISKDDGKTWETDLTVCSDLSTHDIGYPSTVELSDGSLITVFYKASKDRSDIAQQKWNSDILQQKWKFE
ncbi:MAG: exo-alpha-sialidase [Clostridia bacterium]|nr:exo-alpha-sialidase [Clostridia bacterium]